MVIYPDMTDDPMPSHDQIALLFELINNGVIDKHELQIILDRFQNRIPQILPDSPTAAVTEPLPENCYHISIDYNLSLEAMIAAGQYDFVNPDITQVHFPIHAPWAYGCSIPSHMRIDTIAGLVHYGYVMGTQDILTDLGSRNLRPAALPELLALGAEYPALQRECAIVALGSAWDQGSNVRTFPYLSTSYTGGGLYLRYRIDDMLDVWDSCWFFAVFSK